MAITRNSLLLRALTALTIAACAAILPPGMSGSQSCTPDVHASPLLPADTLARADTPRTLRRFMVPFAGGFVRTVIMAGEVGVRAGFEPVRDVVGLSVEAGFFFTAAGPGTAFTTAAIRADVNPLPFTFLERFYVHGERMFFGPGSEYTVAEGFGAGYAVYTSRTSAFSIRAFGELNVIVGLDDPIPILGGGGVILF